VIFAELARKLEAARERRRTGRGPLKVTARCAEGVHP